MMPHRPLATGLLGAVALCISTLASSAEPLQSYFQQLSTLRADFVQTVTAGPNQAPKSSRGRMVLERPGRFRWDYEAPYEQVIVSDGDRVWHYDADLEQVTVQRLDDSMDTTPLALLMGRAPLNESFLVKPIGRKEGQDWFELTPRGADSQFNRIRVALRAGELSGLELDDALGTNTRLSFERMERNKAIDPTEFEFTPPAGADVVGDG
jgi:outer membrane lipoprotein carrier protein